MKLKIEDLKKIPLRIIKELEEIKIMEESNKGRLMIYKEEEKEIKEKWEDLERLIENWNISFELVKTKKKEELE